MKLQEIINQFEQRIPLSLQEDWDQSGLQVGNPDQTVGKVLFSLDICHEVIDYAIKHRFDLIVTHHPLMMKPLSVLDLSSYDGQMMSQAIKNNISIYSSHTNHDRSLDSLNYFYAHQLKLKNLTPLSDQSKKFSKLVVFVPQDHTERLMEALFKVGAGRIGNYSKASFRHLGIGTFSPEEGANPFIGKKNKFEEVIEDKLEMIIPQDIYSTIIQTIEKVHPYETPAFDLIPLDNTIENPMGMGVIGDLAKEKKLKNLVVELKKLFKISKARVVGDGNPSIRRIAICTGSGSSLLNDAFKKKADLFITGDMKYHQAISALRMNLAIFDPGHFHSEIKSVELLLNIFKDLFKNQLSLKLYSNLEDPLKIV